MRRTLLILDILCILILCANTRDHNNNRKLRRDIILPYLYLPRCKFDENSIRNNSTLFELIDKADFVFTGKVSSEINYINNNTIKFSVIVKRLFKNDGDYYGKDDEIDVSRVLLNGEGSLCRLSVRPKYTAIFIGRKQQKIKDIDVTLTFSPVPVTLTNLDRVSEATKGN